jgi:hypothetical protein
VLCAEFVVGRGQQRGHQRLARVAHRGVGGAQFGGGAEMQHRIAAGRIQQRAATQGIAHLVQEIAYPRLLRFQCLALRCIGAHAGGFPVDLRLQEREARIAGNQQAQRFRGGGGGIDPVREQRFLGAAQAILDAAFEAAARDLALVVELHASRYSSAALVPSVAT